MSFILKLSRFLPPRLRTHLKSMQARLDLKLLSFFAWSGPAASLYYCLFSRRFDREHLAVMKGRLAHQPEMLLRRNTHRLEKGLIMRPRKYLFAIDYIEETVNAYAMVTQRASTAHNDELKWAHDVLCAYFEAVAPGMNNSEAVVHSGTQRIQRAQQQFQRITASVFDNWESSTSSTPYPQAHTPELTIDTESLLKLYQRRRSVRWFKPALVEAEKLERAVDMASLAPSACNRQPYKFIIANAKNEASKLAKLAMGTVGFADNIPCLIVVIGELDAYPAERDRHCIYIDASLASMQLMLALETMGLSSCPINWPDIEIREQAMQKALNLAHYQRPIMLMAVGYADPEGGIPYSQKKKKAQLVRYHQGSPGHAD